LRSYRFVPFMPYCFLHALWPEAVLWSKAQTLVEEQRNLGLDMCISYCSDLEIVAANQIIGLTPS
jgi:branched-subunit amino acid transport protein